MLVVALQEGVKGDIVATENERRPRCFRAWAFSPAMPPVGYGKLFLLIGKFTKGLVTMCTALDTGLSLVGRVQVMAREELVHVWASKEMSSR